MSYVILECTLVYAGARIQMERAVEVSGKEQQMTAARDLVHVTASALIDCIDNDCPDEHEGSSNE